MYHYPLLHRLAGDLALRMMKGEVSDRWSVISDP